MARAVLLTGGNLGDVAATLARARRVLERRVGRVVAASTLNESEPWEFEAEQQFLNQALAIETGLSPEELLATTQAIEKELGREEKTVPEQGYRSRRIDIDILFYDDRVVKTPLLNIPHPLIARRAFALIPLVEIMPDFVHPESGKTVRQMLDALQNEPEAD